MSTHVFGTWTAIAAALVVLSTGPLARAAGTERGPVSTEALAQLVAPVALYPDSLLAQVLMASTYPGDVERAVKWVKGHKGVTGDALVEALRDKEWDTSVKSLCGFPDVLAMMGKNAEWTTNLGSVFLSQQDAVMDAIQALRQKANEAGNLKTTEQQTVVVEQKIIKIEPSSPEVVYVPQYNPTYVYGSWPYPAYPPAPVYYPGYYPVATGLVGFGVGLAVGRASYGWCGWNWAGHGVWHNPVVTPYGRVGGVNNININNINNINSVRNNWTHNANRATSIHNTSVGTRPSQLPSTGRRPVSGSAGAGGRLGQRPSYDSTLQRLQSGSGSRGGAFHGMDYGRSERLASARGQASRSGGASTYQGGGSRSYSGGSRSYSGGSRSYSGGGRSHGGGGGGGRRR
ncbi:MAG: DUF3300 domain-containing protein [Candidatus Riflebacteria bacterium]|nr:DUF3300 domain-containing protein [Candidatus Riflebacteria bacterium]